MVDGGGEDGGNVLRVETSKGHTWIYMHAASGSSRVERGQEVEAGDVLADVGQSGGATGPHLHLELRIDGDPVDPRPYLAERGVGLDARG